MLYACTFNLSCTRFLYFSFCYSSSWVNAPNPIDFLILCSQTTSWASSASVSIWTLCMKFNKYTTNSCFASGACSHNSFTSASNDRICVLPTCCFVLYFWIDSKSCTHLLYVSVPAPQFCLTALKIWHLISLTYVSKN